MTFYCEFYRYKRLLPKFGAVFLAMILAACGAAPVQPMIVSTTEPTQSARELPPIDTEAPSTPTFLPYPKPDVTATAEPSAAGPEALPGIGSGGIISSFQNRFTGDLLSGQNAYSFQTTRNTEFRFLMYLPKGFDLQKHWPLILFLHSSLEEGSDLNRLKQRSLPEKLETEADFPFIVISPQISEGFWFEYIDSLEDLLDQLENTLPVDNRRIYLTGFSLGGYGTWAYARQHPERFAAIAPVAGSLDEGTDFVVPSNICNMESIPVWAFHGANDLNVNPAEANRLVDALAKCGDEARITIYPETGHLLSGELSYADPALYDWFLAHHK